MIVYIFGPHIQDRYRMKYFKIRILESTVVLAEKYLHSQTEPHDEYI
jgi:hypothetical protein